MHCSYAGQIGSELGEGGEAVRHGGMSVLVVNASSSEQVRSPQNAVARLSIGHRLLAAWAGAAIAALYPG